MLSKGRLKAYGLFAPPAKEFIKASLVLLLLLAVFFIGPIAFGLVPSPADLLSTWPMYHVDGLKVQNLNCADVINQFEPWYMFNYQCFREFRLPLWNPYGAGGVPHVANMQSSIFSFLTWPFYLLGFTGLSLLVFHAAKLFLTGIFSYYYLRSIKLRPCSSLMGAIGFMFAGFCIVWMLWPKSGMVFLIPAYLYVIEKIVEKGPHAKYLAGIALIGAFGLLSGHPETFIYVPPLALLYLLFRLHMNRSTARAMLDAAARFSAFSALGLGIAAVQLLPTFEYLLNSYGWAVRSGDYVSYTPWPALILNFMPDFYGTGAANLRIPFYVDFVLYQSTAGYVGISLLCLAVFATLARYRDRLVKFYVLLGAWAACAVYGAPLVSDVMARIPLFSHAKNSELMLLLGFSVVVLGAMGLDEVLDRLASRDKSVVKKFALSCLAVALALIFLVIANRIYLETHYLFKEGVGLYQVFAILTTVCAVLATLALVYCLAKKASTPLARNLAVIGLLALVFVETGVHGMLYLPYIEKGQFYQGENPFAAIADQGTLYRATSIDPVDRKSVYPANTQMVYGVYDIRNYDALEVRYSRDLLLSCAEGRMRGWIDLYEVNDNYLDFTGVRWVYSGADLREADENSSFRLAEKYPGYYLFENIGALPRAFMAYNATFTTDDSKILKDLSDPLTDWLSPLIIYGEGGTVRYPGGDSGVAILEYRPSYVKVLVNTSAKGFLVLTATYYPGWNAYVNGKRTNILRADYAFRAVRLDPGSAIVEFKYEPLSFYAGALITALSLLATLVIIIFVTRKKGR